MGSRRCLEHGAGYPGCILMHPNNIPTYPDTSRCIPAAFQGRRRHLLPRRRSAPGWDTRDLLGIRSICPESLPQRHAQHPQCQAPCAPRNSAPPQSPPCPRAAAGCQLPGDRRYLVALDVPVLALDGGRLPGDIQLRGRGRLHCHVLGRSGGHCAEGGDRVTAPIRGTHCPVCTMWGSRTAEPPSCTPARTHPLPPRTPPGGGWGAPRPQRCRRSSGSRSAGACSGLGGKG